MPRRVVTPPPYAYPTGRPPPPAKWTGIVKTLRRLPAPTVPWLNHDWDFWERRFLPVDTPGIIHRRGIGYDTLLARNDEGLLVGVLWYTRTKHAGRPGEVVLYVNPGQRDRGVGTKLLQEAEGRWAIDFAAQSYTREGRALVDKYLRSKVSTGAIGTPPQSNPVA